jgi:hypothetical protein
MAADDSPAARTLVTQLESGRFLSGVDEGRWKVLRLSFPDLYVRVTATDTESQVRVVQDFHLLCDGYPSPGPFVERWDFDKGVQPPQPSSGHASPAFVDALKDWGGGPSGHGGIYRGWQRYAATHNDWAAKRPDHAWNSGRDIAFLLERMYEVVAEQAAWLARRQSA